MLLVKSGNLMKRGSILIKTLTMKKQLDGKFRIKDYICVAKAGFIQ
jgi:hypothetical protein